MLVTAPTSEQWVGKQRIDVDQPPTPPLPLTTPPFPLDAHSLMSFCKKAWDSVILRLLLLVKLLV